MCICVWLPVICLSGKSKLKDKSKLSTSIKFYRKTIYLLRYHFEFNSFVYIRNTILAGCDGTCICSQPLEEIAQRWWFWSHRALKTETCFQRICKITEDKAGHTVEEDIIHNIPSISWYITSFKPQNRDYQLHKVYISSLSLKLQKLWTPKHRTTSVTYSLRRT